MDKGHRDGAWLETLGNCTAPCISDNLLQLGCYPGSGQETTYTSYTTSLDRPRSVLWTSLGCRVSSAGLETRL